MKGNKANAHRHKNFLRVYMNTTINLHYYQDSILIYRKRGTENTNTTRMKECLCYY
jgi:hypothetical protein